MNDCIFCKIVKGDIPSFKIWENEDYIAILDIHPVTKGMTLVLPKEHKPSYIVENDKETIMEMCRAITEVTKILDTRLEGILRTTFLFEGLDVDHLHAKLIPFYKEQLESTHLPPEADFSELEKLAESLKN